MVLRGRFAEGLAFQVDAVGSEAKSEAVLRRGGLSRGRYVDSVGEGF